MRGCGIWIVEAQQTLLRGDFYGLIAGLLTWSEKFNATVRPTPTSVGSDLEQRIRASTVTRYVPGLICEKRKWPLRPFSPVRVALVFISVAVTHRAAMLRHWGPSPSGEGAGGAALRRYKQRVNYG